MGSEHYCLRWNNHQSNLLGVFSQLLQDESLVDVTLACSEGASIRAHKVVLSACSSYFQSLFVDHPSRHPIVILKDVHFSELRTLVEFMYKGEVNVEYCQLSALLKTAESLKVKGLAEMTNLNTSAAAATGVPDVESGEGSAGIAPPSSQPQDLAMSRANPQPQDQSSPDEQSPPRVSPLLHVRRQRLDSRHEPRHESRLELRHEARIESRHEARLESRHEARLESRHELRLDTRHESRHEPHRESIARDPGGKEEPPDDIMRASSPEDDLSSLQSNCGHSDNIGLNMSISTNSNSATLMSCNPAEMRLGGGLSGLTTVGGEPIAGPSGLPPVQQVPLSLKKEVDWDRLPDDKSGGESSSEYRHPLHESESFDGGSGGGGGGPGSIGTRDGEGRLYPCMYCGAGFPHQSKLTRHILSHSLETLKYREAVLGRTLPLPPLGPLLDSSYAPPPPPDDHPLDMELGSVEPGNVVLCKFCGKSFPDVSSLIAHLPVHTGDRPFKCEFCGKAFKLRHHMKDHCRVHTGERPFRCALCGKTFSRSTILKAHEKTHYPKYVRKFLSPSPVDTEEESPH